MNLARIILISIDYFNGLSFASAAPLIAAHPAAVVAALLTGKTVFTRHFFGATVGFLRVKYFAL